MTFYKKLQKRLALLSGLLLFTGVLSVSMVQAYQIRGGDSFRVMQSGNPANSASYTVNSTLRIEGSGVTVAGNAGALGDLDFPEAPISPRRPFRGPALDEGRARHTCPYACAAAGYLS